MLIVIEGIDGSGKGTLAQMLLDRLGEEGKETFTMNFPTYGTTSCRAVETYLNGGLGPVEELGPYFTSMLYAHNRARESRAIKDALAAGKIVVLNRYTGSNIGHQGGKIADKEERREFIRWLLDLEFGIFGLPKPDHTFLLDLPPEIGQQFVDTKQEGREYLKDASRDIHEADVSHLQNARQAYLAAADEQGWTVLPGVREGVTDEQILDMSMPPGEKARSLRDMLEDVWTIIKPSLK